MRFLIPLLSLCCLSFAQAEHYSPQKVAKQYFEVYAKRSNFAEFMSFYAEKAQFSDFLLDVNLTGKPQISNFFDWSRGDFKVVDKGPTLLVEEQLVSGQTVVTNGKFRRFVFNGKTLGPWQFSIRQTFSDKGKITQQQDWINYSPKKILIGE